MQITIGLIIAVVGLVIAMTAPKIPHQPAAPPPTVLPAVERSEAFHILGTLGRVNISEAPEDIVRHGTIIVQFAAGQILEHHGKYYFNVAATGTTEQEASENALRKLRDGIDEWLAAAKAIAERERRVESK